MDLNLTFQKTNNAGVLSPTHYIDGNITYRDVDPKRDFETAYRIFRETIKESVSVLNNGIWPEEERKPFFKKGFSDDGMKMLFHDDKPIGCFCITALDLPFVTEAHLDLNNPIAMNDFINRQTYKALVLQRMYLDPEYQRQGIGSALMDTALEIAHEKKIPLELEVLISNDAGLHAYGSKGYEVYSQIDSKGWNQKYLMRQRDTEKYMPEAPNAKPLPDPANQL